MRARVLVLPESGHGLRRLLAAADGRQHAVRPTARRAAPGRPRRRRAGARRPLRAGRGRGRPSPASAREAREIAANGAPGSRSHASTAANAPKGTADSDSVAATRTVRSTSGWRRASAVASSRDFPIPASPASTAPVSPPSICGQLVLASDERPTAPGGVPAHASRVGAGLGRLKAEMSPRGLMTAWSAGRTLLIGPAAGWNDERLLANPRPRSTHTRRVHGRRT